MRKLLLTFAVCFVILLPALASGSSCSTGTLSTYSVHGQSHDQVQVFAIPLYSLGYQATSADSLSLLEEVRLLRQAVERMSSGQAGALGQEPPHAAVLRQHCAACHSAPNARKNFTLFNGAALASLSPEDTGRLISVLATKQMPPGSNKLSYDDFSKVMAGLVPAAQK